VSPPRRSTDAVIASIGFQVRRYHTLRRVLIVLLLLSFVMAACGDDTTATTGGQDVVFGEGEIPATVPADFPVPDTGIIGSTMIDRVHHRTEFSLQMAVDLTTVAQFFEVELVNRGYVVTSSAALSAQLWRIEFSQGELAGEVTINSLSAALSQAVVTLNVA